MSWHFNIITTATYRVKWILKVNWKLKSWKLSEFWTLCSRRWLKPNLNLVNNLTPMGLRQLKTLLPEGRIKFKSVFLEIFTLSELRIFRSSLFHSITAEGKKKFRNNLCFTFNRGILLIFLVFYVLTEGNNIE